MQKLFLLSIILISLSLFSCKEKNSGDIDNQIVLNYLDKKTNWASNKELAKWHTQYTSDPRNFSFKGKEPYQYVDFKLEEIKHLIWEMENSANRVYINGKKPELGLRVYYAQKEDTINTVVLSPVFKNSENKNKLFDPRSKSHGSSFMPWEIKEYLGSLIKGANPRNMMMLYYGGGDDSGTNLNHGNNCPSSCEN